jgi:ABC-type branched-subunit amino acid transport system ATPase component
MAMNFGTKLAEGDPQEVISSEDFRQVYFGVDAEELL